MALLYQAESETVIATIMVCNTDTEPHEVHVSILRNGETLSGSKQGIYAGYRLADKATLTVTAGITLGPGDSVWVKSDAASVVVYTAFGEIAEEEVL